MGEELLVQLVLSVLYASLSRHSRMFVAGIYQFKNVVSQRTSSILEMGAGQKHTGRHDSVQ